MLPKGASNQLLRRNSEISEQFSTRKGELASVGVAIPTYRHLSELSRLLKALRSLVSPQSATVKVLVVDNDPDESARDVVLGESAGFPFELNYVVEPGPGTPFARNRAISELRDEDFVAFIDDDEVPDPNWLQNLLATQVATDAEIVAGPVLTKFSRDPPNWIVSGGFFNRPRYPTGTDVRMSGAGNMLISRRILELMKDPFDTSFLSGVGEDTFFCLSARSLGARLVWCDEASVEEWVPPSRANLRQVLRRAYLGGNAFVHCERWFGRKWAMPLRFLKLWARLIQAITELVFYSLIFSRVGCVRGLTKMCRALGGFSGLAGRQYNQRKAKMKLGSKFD